MSETHVAVTLAAYALGVWLARHVRTPLVNPTLVGIALVVAYLLATRTSYGAYASATRVLTDLLAPAVVALAVPLYQERALLARFALPVLAGAAVGAVLAVVTGLALSVLFHLPAPWGVAVSGRTATSPIAIALAQELRGAPALSATVSILTGVVGAVTGPAWLTRVGVHHPLARGLAVGVTSHGIGTARMLQESRLAGAAAGLGMGLGGLAVAALLPLAWRALHG